MVSRRDFLKLGLAGSAATFLTTRARFMQRVFAAQSPQIPLAGAAIPKFVDPVPNLLAPESLIVDGGTQIGLEMREHLVQILPAGVIPGYLGTYVWSYLKPGQDTRTSYLGPVVMATRGIPTEMKFTNLLGYAENTNVLASKYGTDQTLHWADLLNLGRERGPGQEVGATTIITSRMVVRDAAGAVEGAVAIFRDVGEVQDLAAKVRTLQDLRELSEAIIRCSEEAIAVSDEHGNYVLVNPAYSRLMGLSEEAVLPGR